FFQAEDGIRDFHVTGVQTCALPISSTEADRSKGASGARKRRGSAATPLPRRLLWCRVARRASVPELPEPLQGQRGRHALARGNEIGRASCRGRVGDAGGAGGGKRTV